MWSQQPLHNVWSFLKPHLLSISCSGTNDISVTIVASVGLQPQEFLLVKSESGPSHKEGKESQEKEAGHSRLAGGRCNKKGVYIWGCLGQLQDEISAPTGHILRIYIETLPGLSPVSHPHVYTFSTMHGSLKAVSLQTSPIVGMMGTTHLPKTERGSETPATWGQLVGQGAVISSWWVPPPAESHCKYEDKWFKVKTTNDTILTQIKRMLKWLYLYQK